MHAEPPDEDGRLDLMCLPVTGGVASSAEMGGPPQLAPAYKQSSASRQPGGMHHCNVRAHSLLPGFNVGTNCR